MLTEDVRQTAQALLASYGIGSRRMQLFLESCRLVELEAGDNLTTEGKRNSHEYLLTHGILHRYNLTAEGKPVTTGFYTPGTVVTPHFARTQRHLSLFSIQSLTEATVLQIAVAHLDALRQQHREFAAFGQLVVEQELSRLFLSETVNRTYQARDRLALFRQQYPGLENKIPHHVIATYLGVTNVSLSRLRQAR